MKRPSRRQLRRRLRRRRRERKAISPRVWAKQEEAAARTRRLKLAAKARAERAAREAEAAIARLTDAERARLAHRFAVDQAVADFQRATLRRLRLEDERHAKRVAAARDLPMTSMEWSPSSGRA